MNRRELLKSMAGSIASYALFRTLFTRDVFAAAVEPTTMKVSGCPEEAFG